jgi:acyl-CoA thioester hydrolase
VRDPAAVGEALYARAETTLVAYDFTTATPRRLRPHEREVLKGVSGEPVPFRWRQRAAK